MCRIVHTVSEGSGGLLKEASHYCGGFSCRRGLSLPALSRALTQLLLGGESVVLPVKVIPKTHNSQTGSRKCTGSWSAVSDRSVLQGRDSVAHH